MEPIIDLNAELRSLDRAIDRSLAEKDQLRDRLHLIKMAALNRVDGDSQRDTFLAEIIGIAEGDPNWLHHARANYQQNYAKLLQFSRELFISIAHLADQMTSESVEHKSKAEQIAHCIADRIEQDLLPQMVVAMPLTEKDS